MSKSSMGHKRTKDPPISSLLEFQHHHTPHEKFITEYRRSFCRHTKVPMKSTVILPEAGWLPHHEGDSLHVEICDICGAAVLYPDEDEGNGNGHDHENIDIDTDVGPAAMPLFDGPVRGDEDDDYSLDYEEMSKTKGKSKNMGSHSKARTKGKKSRNPSRQKQNGSNAGGTGPSREIMETRNELAQVKNTLEELRQSLRLQPSPSPGPRLSPAALQLQSQGEATPRNLHDTGHGQYHKRIPATISSSTAKNVNLMASITGPPRTPMYTARYSVPYSAAPYQTPNVGNVPVEQVLTAWSDAPVAGRPMAHSPAVERVMYREICPTCGGLE